MRYFLIAISLVFLSGCANVAAINDSISGYAKVSNQISLGDSKSKVLAILEPIQAGIEADSKKPSESFIKGGVNHFIYYARSGRVPDGLVTDDEFTPYSFENDSLVAIGWTYLGGTKTQGKPAEPYEPKTTHCYDDGYGGVICNKY